jgi:tetratricopeptide (TPR) repeat protein
MTRILTWGLALAVLVALPVEVAAKKPSRRAMRKARRLYKQGQRFYKRERFVSAAKHFERGYDFDPRPAFLINAAQAYRAGKQPQKALTLYRKFVEVAPKSRLRGQVDGLIVELEKELAPKPKPAITPKPVPDFVKPLPPKPAPKTASRSTPFYKKWWFWTAVAGVVVVGTATGVGVAAASGGDDYVKEGGLGAVRW